MIPAALASYFHILSIALVFITLSLELLTVKPTLDVSTAKRLIRTDSLYGLGAILVVVTGLLRVFYYGKGSDYYWAHPLFLLKFSLFVLIGLLSIYPTVYILKMRKAVRQGEEMITLRHPGMVKRVILIELLILITLPLWAAMVARGIGA